MSRRALAILAALPAIAGCAAFQQHREPIPMANEEVAGSMDLSDTLVIRDNRVETRLPALIIALHGYGMDERQIETLVNIEPGIDHVLIAPRGPHTAQGGGQAWVPLEFIDGEPGVSDEDHAVFIDQFVGYVTDAIESYQADVDRVYVVGYSQGGAMTVSLAVAKPHLAAGFFGIAGTVLPQALDAAKQQEHRDGLALFIAHGNRDPAVSHEQMRADIEQLRRNAVSVEYHEYPVPHVVSAAQRRDVANWIEQLDARHAAQ